MKRMNELSLDEAAQRLGISRTQVKRLITAGVLTGRRVGGNRRGVWLIDAESVEREAKRRQNAKD
jgi:excisionase family DNA binding protein